MVRKERPPLTEWMSGQSQNTDSLGLNTIAEHWLARIRALLPDDGTAVVTVQKLGRRRYLVSFRASAFGESFISEAREENLDEAIRAAGASLNERLEASPPEPPKKNLGERVREMLS